MDELRQRFAVKNGNVKMIGSHGHISRGTSCLGIWSGGANANCPQILWCCKISSTRLLALQCSSAAKSLSTPLL